MNYDFKKVFLRYVLLLSLLIGILYVGIITIFSWQVNKEIQESSMAELKEVRSILATGRPIGQEQYYMEVEKGQIITNHTPLSASLLKQQVLDQQPGFVIKNGKDRYHVEGEEGLYILNDITDYEETKLLLFRLLLILLVMTAVLILGAAYYIAIKPIKTYEKMLQQHKEFIQNASHELKTPIAAISLGTDYIIALDQSKLSPKSLESLKKIKREIKYMQRIIHQSLNLESDYENKEQIKLAPVLDEVIEQQLTLNDGVIIRQYKDDIVTKLSADQLKQMLTILLDNAIKHNDDVIVTVAARQHHHLLQIEVSDNGRGISPQHIDHIFDRYARGDTQAEGSGIGLALLKEQVTQLQGEIKVISELNKKTSFILEFPE
ncbi:HAMP domain-containing histidine kinase [Macrococcus brunensis]|uniref:histidine kinase n=1 Tax=Macrococcus brunensis TaxID=198483 RepID=A0A4R6BFC1_9STAP|nr:HAMP domain-containing sensor histidine kinase [Macrococcus brunensis]TDL98512.1 HAMP domain-containing histidine kinase [Macrococcus brunensis]ULG74431.1 HAMP domain-containing histidine kinase [Macrococcus brunensis]